MHGCARARAPHPARTQNFTRVFSAERAPQEEEAGGRGTGEGNDGGGCDGVCARGYYEAALVLLFEIRVRQRETDDELDRN